MTSLTLIAARKSLPRLAVMLAVSFKSLSTLSRASALSCHEVLPSLKEKQDETGRGNRKRNGKRKQDEETERGNVSDIMRHCYDDDGCHHELNFSSW